MGRRSRSLYVQLVLAVSLIISATFVSFGFMTAQRQTSRLAGVLTNEAGRITSHLAESLASYLVVSDYAGLEEFLVRSAELPDIERLTVVDQAGAGLADVFHRDGDAPRAMAVPESISPPDATATEAYRKNSHWIVWRPVAAGKQLGWVRAVYRLDKLSDISSSVWQSTAALGLVWLAAGIIFIVLVLKRPLVEIARIAGFARDLNSRKGASIDVSSAPAEIRRLGEALNDASRELLASEERLIGERERLAAVLESMGEGLIVIDRDYRIVLANTAYSRQVGVPLAELPGKRCHALSHRRNEPCGMTEEGHPCPAAAVFATGAPSAATHQHTDASGAGVYVETRAFPMSDAEGNVTAVIETVVDVTEKRKLEDQLRQAQKMEAVGQLAGGVAHDFNNILTAIVGYANLLTMKITSGPGRPYLEQILASADRASQLTRTLLAFSRKQVMEMKPLDVNEVVKGVDKLLRRLIGEDVELRTILTGRRLPVLGDAGQIEQVLMNLVTNARDAMPNGGILSIETGVTDMPALAGVDGQGAGLPRAALISVTDTGVGMTEEVREKIFEPFFTTKSVGKGTGLGMSIVYGIIKQHGGAINVYSEPGRGTTFKIYLPVADAPLAAVGAAARQAPRGGTETILLAEDDISVRGLIKLILENAGYRVIEAGDGEEALRLFERAPDDVKLLVTDVVMPRKNGKETHEAIIALRPDVKALFLSGYTADIIKQKGVLNGGVNYLSKPVAPDDLLHKVRDILDGHA